MIQLFIYRKIDGLFLYQDAGSINGIMLDLTDDKDFTLEPIPNHSQVWY